MSRIDVAYGEVVRDRPDLGFDTAGARGRKLHLVPWTDPVIEGHVGHVALCGMDMGPYASPRWASGYICPACAKAAGVRSHDDLVDADTDGVRS